VGRYEKDDLFFYTRLDFNTSKGGVGTVDDMLYLGSIPKITTCCIVEPVGYCGTGCIHHLQILYLQETTIKGFY